MDLLPEPASYVVKRLRKEGMKSGAVEAQDPMAFSRGGRSRSCKERQEGNGSRNESGASGGGSKKALPR